MEPLVLSILGLAGSVKTILTILVVLGILLVLNLVLMAVLILTRRASQNRSAADNRRRAQVLPTDDPVSADDTRVSPAAGAGPRPGRPRRARRILAGIGALLALVLATAALADLFFFESLTRQALGRLTDQAGIRVDFNSARGSFWTGKFHFSNLTARRPDHPTSVFDLRAASAEVDISVRDLLRRRIVFENLELQGVDGSWEQRARVAKEPWLTSKRLGGQRETTKRRPFRIDHFNLSDGRLNYSHLALSKPFATELRLDYLQAAPIHGDRLLFNLLFTGGARGSFSVEAAANNVPGGPALDFVIDPPTAGRQSTWRCEGLPLPVLAPLVGGPLEWFERGLADIVVENREAPGAPGGTLTNWNLVLRDFQVAAPDGTSRLTQMAAAPVAAYLNSKSERLELGLDFELQPEEMRFANASELAALIGTALRQTLTQKFEALKSNIVDGTVDRARQFFKRKGAETDEAAPSPDTVDQGLI